MKAINDSFSFKIHFPQPPSSIFKSANSPNFNKPLDKRSSPNHNPTIQLPLLSLTHDVDAGAIAANMRSLFYFCSYINNKKQMGCGALCGDTTTAVNIANHHSKIALDKLIKTLQLDPSLIATPTYSAFLQQYQQHPDDFQLQSQQKLVRGEEIKSGVLLKWRLVLLGLDRNDKAYSECVGLGSSDPESIINSEVEGGQQPSALIFHDCFVQIEKDISRTFDVSIGLGRRREFENVLKRIANHFPKMGYTQGINFIVSYLFILGYSEHDCFALFVHLATNKRYLLLGLYEDGFPLYTAFTVLFQNVLKRVNQVLYEHMFEVLGIDPSMWICKWFMTFYVYSFPKEFIKYVWDMVIVNGNLGIITIAIGLLEQLAQVIMEIEELSDLDVFLSSLKELDNFNYHINLQRLMIKAYTLELIVSDFNNIDANNNFYGIYIKTQFKLSNKAERRGDDSATEDSQEGQQSQFLLNKWRKALVDERIAFQVPKTANMSNLQLEIDSAGKSIVQKKDGESFQLLVVPSEQQPGMNSTFQTKKRKNSISAKSETPVQAPQRIQYLFNEINQRVEQQEQSAVSRHQRKSRHSKKNIDVEFDELDKFQLQFKEKEKKNVNYVPSLTRNHQAASTREKVVPRTSAFTMLESNSLGLAGHMSIRNDRSFDEVSVSSKNVSARSKGNSNQMTVPMPKNSRICGCKTKTEENRFSNIDQNSEIEQSKDQFSDKDSVSNSRIEEPSQARSIRGVDSHRDRTNNNYMINSHGPQVHVSQPLQFGEGGRSQSDIEVMVLQFKKNKKARVNQAAGKAVQDKLSHIGPQHEQESIESINQLDRASQAQSHCSHSLHRCEVESIR